MDPCTHCELGDEDIATLREQDRSLSRNHLHIRVRLHNLLDSRQWQLVQLIVMIIRLEVVDDLLPVCREDVSVIALQPLVYLYSVRSLLLAWK